MKITVQKAHPSSSHPVRVSLWLTDEEARLYPLGLTQLSAHLEVCLKDHALTGHKATRTFVVKL